MAQDAPAIPAIAPSAEAATPLAEGASAPDATIHTGDGTAVQLATLWEAQPTLLIFYRGGWCPYCVRHLEALAGVHAQLEALGVKVVALSPDRPELVLEAKRKYDLAYDLYSDSSIAAAQAFGLAFRVDDATFNMYKERFSLDLEAKSGHDHRALPLPAAYLVGTDGTILFAHADANYRERVNTERLIEAATAAVNPAK
jgi:peroxiredoxin